METERGVTWDFGPFLPQICWGPGEVSSMKWDQPATLVTWEVARLPWDLPLHHQGLQRQAKVTSDQTMGKQDDIEKSSENFV